MCALIKQLRMRPVRSQGQESNLDRSLPDVVVSRICAAAACSCPACSQLHDLKRCLSGARSHKTSLIELS